MNLSLIRKIDCWVGIPVCFILTIIDRFFFRILANQIHLNAPKKFLFIELSEMGSAILSYSTMKQVKKEYPDGELFFMIFEKNRASVDILGMIPRSNVLTISDRSLFSFLFDVFKGLIKIRKEGVDTVFDLELFARATAIITYLSGAKRRVGFYKYYMEGLYRGDLLTHKIQYNFQQHIAKSFFLFVESLSFERKDYPTSDRIVFDEVLNTCNISSSKENIRNTWKKIKEFNPEINEEQRLVVLNPSAGELPIRAWPVENYILLAKRILENSDCCLIITGTKADEEITSQVFKAINKKRCIDLTGKTSFEELVDLYNVSDILITNDGGPAHFASMTKVKSFVFFGPETPKIYSPLGCNVQVLYSNFPCSPCLSAYNHRRTACNNNKCLQAISVSDVFDIIKKDLCQKFS